MSLHLSGSVGDESLHWVLDGERKTIGRSSKNAIHLPDGTVSKEHAEVTSRGGRHYVVDLGSRNGTRVNGQDAKEPIEIRPGDRIEVGHVQLAVSDRDPVQPVRYSDATVIGSSIRMRADQILEKTSTDAPGRMLRLIADAGRLLVLPRPLLETCEELLGFVARAVPASRYVLLLLEEGSPEPVQFAARTAGGRANQPLALSRSIMRTVLDEVTSVLTGDAARDPRFQGQHSIVAQAVHSAMAVPLFDNERVLGLLYVDSQDFSITFQEEQLELLTLLANMAAVKITNARLLEAEAQRARLAQELATATRIQRNLLPPAPPEIAGWEIDAYLETCYEVGGDLYDFHVGAGGELQFLVGDVTGKGMGAALLMSSFLASARVLYDTCRDPIELASRLSTILHRSTDSKHFVTGIVGRLDPATGRLDYVNAGHPPPCLLANGTLTELASTGVPFGVLAEFPYQSDTVQLEPGATLVLFSDGIPEAQRGEEFFEDERIQKTLLGASPHSDLAEWRRALLDGVKEFVGDSPRTDDVTLLMLRRTAS